jgi:hypothetical protein
MKKIIYILFVFLTAALAYSCSEEQVGQTPTDSVAPGPIKNPVAAGIPGGAIITYELPDDDDLLYVKAVYTINGVERNTSASLNYKILEIKGFGNTDPQTIFLYCVDRSQNMSAPVVVTITPETPPLISIAESLDFDVIFGGFRMKWKNETRADVSIVVTTKGEDGEEQEVDVIYSNAADGGYNVRNLPSIEQEFSAYVVDRWNNRSTIRTTTLTPLYEELLNKKLHKQQLLPGDLDGYRWDVPFSALFDDIVTGSNFWYPIVVTWTQQFTIDLGVTTKLSRYALWHRDDSGRWLYIHDNPKYWEIYGIDVLPNDTKPMEYWTSTEKDVGWKKDWVFLGDGESFKPSGMENGLPVTQEDMDFAQRGFQFDFPADAPPIRYIRFHIKETWNGEGRLNIAELSFWGQLN